VLVGAGIAVGGEMGFAVGSGRGMGVLLGAGVGGVVVLLTSETHADKTNTNTAITIRDLIGFI
jgi:hypothetical protein